MVRHSLPEFGMTLAQVYTPVTALLTSHIFTSCTENFRQQNCRSTFPSKHKTRFVVFIAYAQMSSFNCEQEI